MAFCSLKRVSWHTRSKNSPLPQNGITVYRYLSSSYSPRLVSTYFCPLRTAALRSLVRTPVTLVMAPLSMFMTRSSSFGFSATLLPVVVVPRSSSSLSLSLMATCLLPASVSTYSTTLPNSVLRIVRIFWYCAVGKTGRCGWAGW